MVLLQVQRDLTVTVEGWLYHRQRAISTRRRRREFWIPTSQLDDIIFRRAFRKSGKVFRELVDLARDKVERDAAMGLRSSG